MNAITILKDGLKGRFIKPQNGIYLSPNIEVATRYAVWTERTGYEKFAIFKVNINKNSRTKNLAYDPMDRWEDAWEYEVEPDSDDDNSAIIDTIDGFVKYILKNMKLNHPVSDTFIFQSSRNYNYDSVESYRNLSLYEIFDDIMNDIGIDDIQSENYNFNAKKLGLKLVREFIKDNSEISDNVSLKEDGRFAIDQDYFKSKRQLEYRAKSLDAKSIRGIYLPSIFFPEISGETVEVSPELLPHEAKFIVEQMQDLAQWSLYEAEKEIANVETAEDAFDFIEKMKGFLPDQKTGVSNEIESSINQFETNFNNGMYHQNEMFTPSIFVDDFNHGLLPELQIINDWINDHYGDSINLNPISLTYLHLPDENARMNAIQIIQGHLQQQKAAKSWYKMLK